MTTSGSPVAASPMTTPLAIITVGYPFLISLGMALGRPRLTVVVVAMVMLVPGAMAWRSGLRGESLWRLA